MSKPVDKTPKMFPRFIQIAFSPSGTLFALDESGVIYRRDPATGNWREQAGRTDDKS